MRQTGSIIFAYMSLFTIFLVTTVLMPVLAVADINLPCHPAQQNEIQTEHPHQHHSIATSHSASGLMLTDAVNEKTPDNSAKNRLAPLDSVHDCCDPPAEMNLHTCSGHSCADHNGCDCPQSTSTSVYLSGMTWTLQFASVQLKFPKQVKTITSDFASRLHRPPIALA